MMFDLLAIQVECRRQNGMSEAILSRSSVSLLLCWFCVSASSSCVVFARRKTVANFF